ncbi:senescence-associated protein AAF, chlorolplastic isoform X2 [Mangifera indica]|uniref:senescence-associated protein AAF, chlorolplastic isoform X2 n=1 Tax=Mangifera indica TaxID=29780 RepID=UPI001CF9A3BC|nr:senescence-associated protein AAF, chlorolplastic isoform X2 [Mangifera indica]
MAFTASKISSHPVVPKGLTSSRSLQTVYFFGKSTLYNKSLPANQGVELQQASNGHFLAAKLGFFDEGLSNICGKPIGFIVPRRTSILCWSMGTRNGEAKECIRPHSDCSNVCRSIMRLDARARQDVAILGSEFLKLDARARKDTEKIDRNVKKKAERLHHIATILKDKAQSRLKRAADKHWSDGALEADLRLADFRAKQRAMEDALMALEFVKNILDMMVSKMYKFPLCCDKNSLSGSDMMECITLEKNGKTLEFFPGELSTDRITAIQEVYWSMASALSEADGIDYTDPEELELLITTLIGLDAMDGKSSVSLLAECSSSPDVSTRQALANALAAAPSMWTLGNAGMGALQRLAEDSNPTVAAAASKAINELKKQWEIEEGDSWRFMMNLSPAEEADGEESSSDADTN